MVSLNCIIIDDEIQARSVLKHELAINCPEVKVVCESGSVDEAIQLLKKVKVDIIFLDIQLTDGLGFEVLEAVDQPNAKVIFTTAYGEYALRALKLNALDYLLKPVDPAELKVAVGKAANETPGFGMQQLKRLFVNNGLADAKKRIALSTSEGTHLIELEQIIYCNSDGNYTVFYLMDKTRLMVAKTLKEFDEMLSAFGFERVHNSYLINMRHLKSYVNKDGGYVLMSDQSNIPVSQRKKATLLEVLNSFNRS